MADFLILGPMSHKKKRAQGGIVVSFNNFVEHLDSTNLTYKVIDLNKNNYNNQVFALLSIFVNFLLLCRKYKYVSLHGTAADFIYIAPVIVFISRISGKKISLRKFAGSFIEVFEKLNFFQKKSVIFSLKNSNVNLFETQYLVDYFSKYNNNTFWFPNSRGRASIARDIDRPYEKKFIFLGHICQDKGVDEILKVSTMLDPSYTIDLYGFISEERYNDFFWKKYPNASYKGELKPKEVVDVLCQYDALLLPTYWKGEGYPGVIIESFSVGLPVIATNLKGIKELITDGSGVLVDQKNPEKLKSAIKGFTPINYPIFSKKSLERFDDFENETVISRMLDLMS